MSRYPRVLIEPCVDIFQENNEFHGVDWKSNVIVDSNSNPTTVIEAVWTYLGSVGAGEIRLVGPGETWIISSTIDSQAADCTLISDWGLTLLAQKDLDDHVLVISHQRCVIRGLHINGNRTNQSPEVAGTHLVGICLNSGHSTRIEFCYIHDCYTEAILTNYPGTAPGSGSDYVVITNNLIVDNNSNGITIGYGEYCETSHNIVTGHSDVALTHWTSIKCVCTGNIVYDNEQSNDHNCY